MTRQNSDGRKPGEKALGAAKTIDEYLSSVPEPARSTLQNTRAAIRSAAPPEATEIISYRIPAFKYKKVVMRFAAFSNHCSLFPTKSILKMFKEDLRNVSTSKGTIQFPKDKPLPKALIRKMVKARIAQIEGKKRR